MIAAENWCIKVADKVYGPYSSDQMRKLAHEGRLASWSLISPAGSRAWREAREESRFANFFGQTEALAGARSEGALNKPGKDFGKNGKTTAKFGRSAPETHSRTANFVVVFDAACGTANRVEAAMFSLGPAFRLTENVWSVTCELTAVGVRNAIAPYLTPHELIFVVDSTRGRSSWQNFSLEEQSKVAAAYALGKQ